MLLRKKIMNPKDFCDFLDKIQESIFKKLDKYGTYRRVDEDAARDAVSRTIESAKNYFGRNSNVKTTRTH